MRNGMLSCVLMAAAWVLLGMGAVAWSGPVPDTGQEACYDAQGNVIVCPEEGQDFAGQDAGYSINPMSFTKLDAQGNALSDNATEWVMVRDNVTGLIWEVKTDDGGIHDRDNQYTWYDPDPKTNGGDAGTAGDGTDTHDFIQALNQANFGGHADWRMPTLKELTGIIDYGTFNPAIDTQYFLNTQSSRYWSSTTYANDEDDAWSVLFYCGDAYSYFGGKSDSYYVRAVRSGQ